MYHGLSSCDIFHFWCSVSFALHQLWNDRTRGEMRNAYKISSRKPGGKRRLEDFDREGDGLLK
jgi:hypothetical protein